MADPASTSAGIGTLAALLLFIAASVWLGTVAQRVVEKGSFLKGYFLGNRGLGAWALALTATVQSGGTFMGFPSYVYTSGWIVALWISAYMVVPISGFGVLGKRFAQLSRRTGAITVPDLFRARFASPAAGLMASLLILFFMTFMMVAQFKAGALVMKISWPGSGALALVEDAQVGNDRYYYLGLTIFSLTVVGYTLIGGFLAAVWTDLFQSVMMFIGVMILLPLTLAAAGGLAASSEKLRYEVSVKAISKDERAAHVPGRARAEERLRELDAALRRIVERTSAERHAAPAPSTKQLLTASKAESESSWLDPITGKPLQSFGDQAPLDPPGSVQRRLLVLTPHDDAGWQSALYSNGRVRSGVFSRPGELNSGPGPFDWQPLGLAFSFFFVWVFSGMGSPSGMVRIMACKDTPTIRRSIFLLACYNMCIYLPLIVICVCGRTLLPDLAVSDEIIPRLALLGTERIWGGSFIAGLILAAPFGAVMATVSSYLVVIASGLVHDVYQRFINPAASERTVRRLSHAMMIVMGAVAVAANLYPPLFLQALVVFSGTCGATTFVAPALMVAFWRRATAAGAMAAMGVGVAATVSLYARGWFTTHSFEPYEPYGLHPIVWGLANSHLAGIVVSLCTAPPPAPLVSKLFDAPGGR
ncbi:MAG TPA: sodium:solute symporter [Pirellulales bacterium]|nr:sodium:solute symporter [Pirellulales bacterium]